MDCSGAGGCGDGWSDAVEDLVDRGDVEGAIAVLESIVSKIEILDHPRPPGDLRLAAALSDLADLYSARGFSLKADDLRSRALLIRAHPPPPTSGDSKRADAIVAEHKETRVRVSNTHSNRGEEDDDWEAVADRAAADEVLIPSQNEAGATSSSPSCDDKKLGKPKRRGRGSFLYEKSCLYSDQPDISESGDEAENCGHQADKLSAGIRYSSYGTSHVLVLYDFPPSTRTTELEKLFDTFRDRGVVIRWVNDTIALAVFRTPSIANEAQRGVCCPFKVRTLSEDDDLLPQLSTEDLEPPYPRPKTSARTAERLIAQGMGIKLSTNFGSNELRKQEAARKNRILARQNMKDDAWGSDNP